MCKPKEDYTKLSCHILEKTNLLYQNNIWSLQLHFENLYRNERHLLEMNKLILPLVFLDTMDMSYHHFRYIYELDLYLFYCTMY